MTEYESVVYPKDAKYCLCCGVPLLGSPKIWDYKIVRGAKICDECCLRKERYKKELEI